MSQQHFSEAERRVEAAKRDHSDTLDLRGLRLRAVPDGVSELTWLRELKLNDNRLSELPESLGRLSGLAHLGLGDNWLGEVPEWITGLRDLAWLDLGGNQIIEVPVWIGDLTKLTSLGLRGCDLDTVPEWIPALDGLTKMDLGDNFLTELPASLGNLTGLTILNLGGNRLTSIPPSLARLTRLTDLELSQNRLSELPAWVGQLEGLRWLGIDGSHLAEIPAWIGDLTALTHLGLPGCRLTEVPAWIARLADLTFLDLGSNWLTEMPAWIGDLTELSSLQLGNNRLRALPEALKHLAKLTDLNISGNQLTELPAWIERLDGLSQFDIGGNRFRQIPNWLGNLTKLTRLDLVDSQLDAVPDWVANLTSLTELDLGLNQITEIPEWIDDLAELTSLQLWGNPLRALPETLRHLTELTDLDISGNQFTEIPAWIGSLTDLTSLNLATNRHHELPSSISGLTNLRELVLSGCRITDFPDWIANLTELNALFLANSNLGELPDTLKSITKLEILSLAHNKLETLPDWISSLPRITTLYLDGNQFGEVPEAVRLLRRLQSLRISDNGLTQLPDWMGSLARLRYLWAGKNRLAELPETLSKTTGLTWIDLSDNQLTTLPAWLADRTCLTHLELGGNRLNELPDWVGKLTGITFLNISSNELTALPESLRNLTALSHLYLQSNRLTQVPDWLLDLPSLERLYLADNPTLISPPPEIAASGTESVLAFLRARRNGATRQWISKLLVVGEGGVGKTSLIKALTDAEHDPAEETTHGIRVNDLRLQHPDEAGVQMRLSTWDFGGQQIYHATHQFFMTDRSLFLLLWNARLGWEQGRLHYWLDIIKSRAPESPVLIIATHADASQRPADLPTDDLRREYPQIADCLVVDNETRRGLDDVRGKLARRAADLPLMGTEWPTTWLNASESVQACPENRITPEHMWQLMAEAGVTDPEQQQYIAVAMHQLGNVLYYHDDPELAQTVVLRPEWVNEYISKVLDSAEVDKAHGLLTHAEMSRLWARLDRGMRDHFLGMMDKYEISFRVADEPAGVVSLVVERLPWNPPPYEEEWNALLDVPGASEIRVIYQLNTIPPGIPTWFIARSHRFTTKTHWRTGAVLTHPDGKHKALLRANPQRKTVELTVRGPAPSYFFSVLDDGFNRTLERYPGLEIRRLVPCPCEEDGTCTETFEYNDLLRRLQRKPPRHEIECRKSGEDVNVPQLLLGLAPSERDSAQVTIERLTAMLSTITDQHEYMQRTLLKLLRTVQDHQEVTCPSVFSLSPLKQRATGNRLELRLYCEEPGAWHPLPGEAGRYEINEPAEWLQKIKPHLSQLLTVLKHAAPLAGPVLGMTVAHVSDQIKAGIETMTEVVSQIPEPSHLADSLGKDTRYPDPSPMSRASNEADFRALEVLLLRLDPDRAWGGLSRTITPEGLTLYLCREHAEVYRRAVRL